MMIVNIPSGYTGRGSLALSAKNPVTPMTAMARRDIGKLSSCACAMLVNPRFAMTVGW
jgi:hypothetical protein